MLFFVMACRALDNLLCACLDRVFGPDDPATSAIYGGQRLVRQSVNHPYPARVTVARRAPAVVVPRRTSVAAEAITD
ncbi:MAG: hypothetical protein JSS02_00980 [Planctomycetes bacterium]|nr:hypothetical protein [Planctomycetota bacterium]